MLHNRIGSELETRCWQNMEFLLIVIEDDIIIDS